MLNKCRILFSSFLIGTCATAITPARAQDYPNKAVRFVVPYGAGATLDLVARVVGQELAKILGQAVVIENKPGADAMIGFEYVAKQVPADGYTIVIAAVSGLATLPLTSKSLRFDPLKDLPPVVGMVEGKYILTTPATFSAKTFAEFVAMAKASPGKLNYGASSTTVRLQTDALMRELGLNVVYVPYRSGPNYIQALATNEIQLGFMSESSAISIADRSRVLAVTGARRSEAFPNAPTFAELGMPGVMGVAYSLNLRAGTPKPIVDRLQAATQQALRVPEVRTALAKMGLDAVAQSSEVAAKRLADEARMFAEVAKRAGIKPE